MENQLVWKEEYNIGVDVIDKEHQRLFKIINKLFAFGKEEKKSKWACQEGIKYFKDHAVKHFLEEEKYMMSVGYEGLAAHRHQHEGFQKKMLPALEAELEQTNYSENAVDHFLGVCIGWLIGHTLTEDRAITGEGVSKWENLLPEEELEAMKKVIVQLVYDMFRLESRVLSDGYSGEKFGRGIYCRLVYGMEQEEENSEIFLAFEEKLLINTVGKVMGIETNRLDTMLVNATRLTAQQFVKRVMEHLPDAERCEIKEENLLTYEQFQDVFEKEKMQASLLFDTGEGYFAYCVIAPHMLEKGAVTPIGVENAMEEVEEYLKKRDIPQRKKILVVDDSMTIRHGMKQLLCEDYEIAVAASGMSAIRSIALDSPDLVLLDYEMPVCDGKQVLEMIRSEEDFAKIPIIFLTGRTDPATVKKLVSLKPDGYLAKYLKPEEIKQKIDAYFTGEGDFAFCVIAPHMSGKGAATPISVENAMEEVEEYLKKREIPQRKKILVVDDSMTIRQGMNQLLCEDYEIAMASSGMSAIHSISMDRPDLVLLDYEMPVCDGKQVLEMIRSETNFAGIPVIFLTGRTDPATVRKLISLKPDGYLAKYLKPEEIKQKIDAYFEKKKD